MANNRIYMRCRGCGACLYLGKSYLHGYYYTKTEGCLEEKLNRFFEDHNYCPGEKAAYIPYDEEVFRLPEDCGGCDGSFDIVYENDSGTGYEVE